MNVTPAVITLDIIFFSANGANVNFATVALNGNVSLMIRIILITARAMEVILLKTIRANRSAIIN